MALVLADRVKETTTTTGTGAYTLAGAADSSFETFASIGNGNTTYYACTDGSDFEVGIGTYTASGTTLARTTILQSSNSDNAVNWGAGTKDIFCTQPAEKAVFRDASGHIIALDGRNLTNVDAATLDSIDSGSFLRSDAADSFSGKIDATGTIEFAGGTTFDPSGGGSGTDTATDVGIALKSGVRLVGTHSGYIRTLLEWNSSSALQIGRDNTSLIAHTKIYGGNNGVELYEGSSKKFETTSTGAEITGYPKITGGTLGTSEGDTVELLETSASTGNNLKLRIFNERDTAGTDWTTSFTRIQQIVDVTEQSYIQFNGTGKTYGMEFGTNGDELYQKNVRNGQVELYFNNVKKFETTSSGATVTGTLVATSLDISGDVDVDGTLEADAMTLNGTAITSTATLSTGISNNNVPKFTSGVADNDFLKVAGTAIEGRSASEVLSDIGGITASSTDTLTNKTLTTPVINGFSGTGDGSLTGNLSITNTSDNGPTLSLISNDPSDVADFATEGHIKFFAENDASQSVEYANIEMVTRDVTDGSEEGRLEINLNIDGTSTRCFIFDHDNFYLTDQQPIQWLNWTSSHEYILKPTTISGTRTVLLPDASGTILLADGDGSSLTNVNATTLDSIDSTSFLRSDAADTKTSGNLTFSDDVQAKFGDGGDLQISHDGSNSIIFGTTGSTFVQQNGFGYVGIQGKNGVDGIRVNSDDSGGGGNVELYHVGSKKLETTSDGASITGDLTLTSTDAGATENPTLDLYRNSASPADNDILGHIHFSGENDADQKVAYGEIEMRALDVSDGTEDGRLVINSILNGTTTTHYATGFGFNQFFKDVLLAQNINIQFEGATNDAVRTTLTVADPSSNRTVTLPDASGTVQLTDGSGASLTSLNASQLTSGTVPNARLDAQLQDVAGLAVTNGGFIVGDGSNFVLETGDTVRTSLGLGTAAVLNTGISNTNVPKFTSGVADNDFLRVDGTAIEGRSASEVLSDISAMPLAGGTFTGDVTFTGASYNVVFDISDNALEFADNAKATFGADADLEIYHNGTRSEIKDTGTGVLCLISNQIKIESPTGEDVARFIQDSDVILYQNNTERFRTTSSGTTTTGTSYITGNVVFEGSTADAYETTLTVTDPTADRTITLPNATGTVQLTDGSGANLTSLNASQLTSGTVPNARLDAQLQDVAGLAVTNGNFIVGDGSNFVAESGSTARDSLSLGTSSDVQFDSFGVGTAASGTTGEIRATADITSNYSDERLKNIHGTIPNALDKVKSLGGYYFTENEIAKSLGYDNDAQQVGVIAQEVEKVLPEAVKPAPIDDKYLTVQYEKMVPLLIEAMKEQQAKIEELESRLAKLEA